MQAIDTKRGSRNLLTHLTLAGTAALAGSAANAQIIVTPVNESIGFAPGDLHSFTSTLPGANQFHINAINGIAIFFGGTKVSTNHFRTINLTAPTHGGIAGLHVRTMGYLNGTGSKIATAPAGNTFGNVGSSSFNRVPIANTNTVKGYQGHSKFLDQFFAFKFQDTTDGNQTDYGWIEASLTDTSFAGLNLNVIAYAYDASGAKIETGQTSNVPEPSAEIALAAFSALTLGAAGVRRLKVLCN